MEEQDPASNNDAENFVKLNPGDCFGWFSSVSAYCHPSTCIRSEWCKSYTLGCANKAESMKKDLDEIGRDSSDRIIEKQVDQKTQTKNLADLGKQGFFDQIVNAVAGMMKHDSIKYSPKRDSASLKIGGRVVAFLAKKRNEIVFEIGGRGKNGSTYRVPFGENMETVKAQIADFIKEHDE